jgi:DNA primase small subunit
MEQEPWGSPQFVGEQFAIWYRKNADTIPAPLDLPKREFAFLTFQGRGMHRHIQLATLRDLQRYLRNNAPMHSYHSSSYYENPTADMALKGWMGADLVFDIDSDHVALPCQETHDKWWCRNCDEQGTGHPPEICKCGKAQFTTETWLCADCLQAMKYEAEKLLDILISDFGAKIEEIITNFSGNRGYHVHVHSEAMKGLNQNSRREIVDYILAIGLEVDLQGFKPGKGARSTLAEGGWRGRTGRALYDYIASTTDQEIRALKMSPNATRTVINSRDEVLDTLMTKHPSNLLPLIPPKQLDKLVAKAIKLQASEIDTVVTTDIHRLIRMPKTLHGKTGWQVQTIPYGKLPSYDPLRDAVIPNKDMIKLEFKGAPKIEILDEEYGPYEEGAIVDMPIEAALFFLCKKGARVVK